MPVFALCRLEGKSAIPHVAEHSFPWSVVFIEILKNKTDKASINFWKFGVTIFVT